MAVFDLADPTSPEHVVTVPTEGTVKDLAIKNGYIYLASGTAGIEIVDARDRNAIRKVQRIDTPGSVLGIDANAGHVVVTDWNDVRVFRITEGGANLTRVGHQKAYAREMPTPLGRILDVTLRDNTLFMAEWAGVQAHQIIPEARAPDIELTSTLEFARTEAGEETFASLVVRNIGERPLRVEDIDLQAPFFVDSSSFEVPPGGQRLLEIRFAPNASGPANSRLTVKSDDPDEPNAVTELVANQAGLQKGDRVPDLTFTDLSGFTHRLSDVRGQPVLLAYFATF